MISHEHIDHVVERVPIGRAGRPDVVAGLVCLVTSDDCSFSTGSVCDISGGRAVD
jgi:NAD(P)-dependent dehydrogenase (short-subunit alcohol dehydrogenase family)